MPSNATKDTVAGAVGGVAQVLIGQPFDIIKVRLQANGGSATQVAQNVWRKEGPFAFYKGTLMPLLGVGACLSIQFGSFTFFKNLIEDRNARLGPSPSLSLGQFYLAGGAAGLTNSVISGPIEHIRIRLQTQPDGAKRLYRGPLDCVRKIVSQAGIPGLYRGQVVTLFREFHGYGVWFATYEGLVGWLMRRENKERGDIPNWKLALCGGLAGEALWLLSHPLDVVKSKMQADGLGSEQRYRSMSEGFRQTWRQGGVRSLFQGLVPALLRAMPVSAGTFAAVEASRRILNG